MKTMKENVKIEVDGVRLRLAKTDNEFVCVSCALFVQCYMVLFSVMMM